MKNGEPKSFAALHQVVKAARANLDENAWDYVIGGADTETTVKRNRRALDKLGFRPRVLNDVSEIELASSLFGKPLRIPVVLAPVGSLQQLHPGGGADSARGAARFGTMSILSSVCEPGLEKVADAAPGDNRVFQLYVRGDADWVDDYARRAIAGGYSAFCLTVDLDLYGRRERDVAKGFLSTARQSAAKNEIFQERLDWDDVKRFKDTHDIPLVIKGIATAEDAMRAVELGVDGVYVSNHGGRQLDHGLGGADMLPGIVDAVGGRATIIIDGGFMRGTDVVKAIALGADAVGVGRLHALAMAAGGADAVNRMLELLEQEIRICVGLLGLTRLSDVGPEHICAADPVADPHVLSAFPLIEEGY